MTKRNSALRAVGPATVNAGNIVDAGFTAPTGLVE
jgi:hypothetical protein